MRENTLDVKNLCSRKLWELLQSEKPATQNNPQKCSIEQELIIRRHYLKELEKWRNQVH